MERVLSIHVSPIDFKEKEKEKEKKNHEYIKLIIHITFILNQIVYRNEKQREKLIMTFKNMKIYRKQTKIVHLE